MIQVVIILVVLLGAGGFGSWTYMQKLQADNEVYRINEQVYAENETKLNDAILDQEVVIAEKAAQAAAIQEANNILRVETDRLDKEKANLAKKLGRHQLDILAVLKLLQVHHSHLKRKKLVSLLNIMLSVLLYIPIIISRRRIRNEKIDYIISSDGIVSCRVC